MFFGSNDQNVSKKSTADRDSGKNSKVSQYQAPSLVHVHVYVLWSPVMFIVLHTYGPTCNFVQSSLLPQSTYRPCTCGPFHEIETHFVTVSHVTSVTSNMFFPACGFYFYIDKDLAKFLQGVLYPCRVI